MEQNLDSNQDFKDRLYIFFKNNKKKIYILFVIILMIALSSIYLKNKSDKQNTLISEKFIQAGIHLAANDKEKAKIIYEEIIFSKNKFYSILSLNTILEKKLVLDREKILNYFKLIENVSSNDESRELINLKKALYLIKESDNKNGDNLLQNLIESNSTFKSIAIGILED